VIKKNSLKELREKKKEFNIIEAKFNIILIITIILPKKNLSGKENNILIIFIEKIKSKYLLLNSKLFKVLEFVLKNSVKTKIVFLGYIFKKKKILTN
jgi:hypothetical protein